MFPWLVQCLPKLCIQHLANCGTAEQISVETSMGSLWDAYWEQVSRPTKARENSDHHTSVIPSTIQRNLYVGHRFLRSPCLMRSSYETASRLRNVIDYWSRSFNNAENTYNTAHKACFAMFLGHIGSVAILGRCLIQDKSWTRRVALNREHRRSVRTTHALINGHLLICIWCGTLSSHWPTMSKRTFSTTSRRTRYNRFK